MNIQEIAQEIMIATTQHAHASIATGKHPDADDLERQKAMAQMKYYEERLVTILNQFKALILKEASETLTGLK